ncbi:hypothetical protein EZJ19_13540 [Parasulfuritortus cantonensis]|uniref:Hydantoinase A/oxoprolinase domain-containing protein n=1 Tax=Parasulfuritortus cantonensis TaxID=2528202 RepID=A0A4R1B5T7_9PROT|nr:hydantoinase/oxoprolinase family protein [Parasulfuritortus cantonensis]TCJ11887.1 hypothetical protein EZJ19_13540 [Parasulfuritortus cantonensis]
MTAPVMGWDVGGAHLKAARLGPDGRLTGVWQEPCPLWRGLHHLDAAVARIREHAGTFACGHAVTMTGEMADLFDSRDAGVEALAGAMTGHLAPAPVWFYAGPAWVAAGATAAAAGRIASANWHASARLLASRVGEGLLVDIGSTTTDIIALKDGTVASTCLGDADRLEAGELVYTGVARTPLMAVADEAPVGGHWLATMAEHFATTADVYRVLGWLPETADQHDSADGGAKTAAASGRRLARMVGLDAAGLAEDAARELAAWFAQAQLQRIERAARLVLSRARLGETAPLIMAGAGAFLGVRLGQRLERPVTAFHHVLPDRVPAHGWCAPAVAVAYLLAEDGPCA